MEQVVLNTRKMKYEAIFLSNETNNSGDNGLMSLDKEKVM